jgi:hypothetical protein
MISVLIAWDWSPWRSGPTKSIIRAIAQGGFGVDKIRMYSPVQVGICSFVGGPCAAVFVLWKNFQSLGKNSFARQTLVWGLLLTLLIFSTIPFLPEKFPNTAIPVAYTAFALAINRQRQMSKKEISASALHEVHSGWNVLGISVSFLVATLVALVLWILLLDYLGIASLD